jgi:anti-anti-sigma regulatory factor
MDIRIDTNTDGQRTVVNIAGRLEGPAVEQVRKVCDQIEGYFVLDLSNIISADTSAIALIRALCESGAEARGGSPYIRFLLDDAN